MTTKYLRVTMPDGSRWDVPAEIIAEDRALYYADLRKGEEPGESQKREYKEEFNYTMANNDELKDWAANNMNWDDVENYASQVGKRQMSDDDFQEGWVNGKKEIVVK